MSNISPTNLDCGEVYRSPIVDSDSESKGRMNFLELMDEIEMQIERLRSNVAYLEEEKDGILTALDSIRHSEFVNTYRDDEIIKIERLAARLGSVEVRVNTVRDGAQEEALYEVNSFIDKLIMDMENDMDAARIRCLKFINTCTSQDNGPTDPAFENVLLGCTLDDQKRIQKRLCGLKSYFDKLSVVTLND